jgi:hypothetical protein
MLIGVPTELVERYCCSEKLPEGGGRRGMESTPVHSNDGERAREHRILTMLTLLVLGISFLALSGCATSCTSTDVLPPSANLKVGQHQHFILRFTAYDGTTEDLSAIWSVEPATGASIDGDGNFVATVPGEYTVTGVHGDDKDFSQVTVEGAVEAGKSLFNNWNIYGVSNGGTAPTFTLGRAAKITLISDYHYNYGKGEALGTIGLRSSGGTVYGPWSVTGQTAQGGVVNGVWNAHPDVVIPAGTYTVMDSSPETWSQDSASHGVGFVLVDGVSQ